MGRFLFLPLILCLLWLAFLRYNGIPISQGARGFVWIIGVSAIIICMLALAIWLTA
ncbi:hypothetical protein KDN34_11245 [Shewanella yunxiaonensis]|uniref:Uncharacterized protein n=1 Tax=Shewanella yunxiaonensis TaxID=2829809 RepID=A0ABX7YRL6_9GAMM|nr:MULTISPECIES: hypothetical protein [Shewanella]MDF0534777.1 hypothetical protein [Shewanella sp. A32]QUN04821.1 hypothetical protein KDN34_11245 [Shewanella yunxiaonensis]